MKRELPTFKGTHHVADYGDDNPLPVTLPSIRFRAMREGVKPVDVRVLETLTERIERSSRKWVHLSLLEIVRAVQDRHVNHPRPTVGEVTRSLQLWQGLRRLKVRTTTDEPYRISLIEESEHGD